MSYVEREGVLVPVRFAAPRQPEMNEVATTRDGRDITRGYLAPALLQQPLDDVLQLRGGGDYLIYRELLRDDQIGSTFQQRRLAVISKEWGVDPGGERPVDQQAAEFIRNQLHNLGWDRITDRMLFGVFYGYAVAECIWQRQGKHIGLADIKVRERRRFGFDGEGRLRLKTMHDPQGELLPDRKFWAFSTGSDNDDEPYGLGLAHWLYWPAFFKKADLKYWLVFLERFGQPTALGEYPDGKTDEHKKAKLLEALQAINTDSGITIPQGMKITLLEAARSGTADYAALYEKMDEAIAKVVLGQTASVHGTPGRLGNDELQGDVRQDLIKADADLISESFNRSVVRWLIDWNFPGAAYPRVYRKVELDEDLLRRAQRDQIISSMGYKPAPGYINETYGGEWEERAMPDYNWQQPEPEAPAFAASTAQPSPAELLTNQLETRAAPVVESWLDTIETMLEQAQSLEEFRAMLLAAFADLPTDQLGELIGQASTAAQAAGFYDVEHSHG